MRGKFKSLYGRKRLVHSRRTYTLREAAVILGMSYFGIKKWVPKGLKSLGGKPALFLGSEIIGFIDSRRKTRSRPTTPGTLYCMRCKVPRAPAGALLEYVSRNDNVGRVSGTCDVCGVRISQTANLKKLTERMPGITIKTR